jgi:hypothetical protein
MLQGETGITTIAGVGEDGWCDAISIEYDISELLGGELSPVDVEGRTDSHALVCCPLLIVQPQSAGRNQWSKRHANLLDGSREKSISKWPNCWITPTYYTYESRRRKWIQPEE